MENNENNQVNEELTRIVVDDVVPLKFFDRIISIFISPGKVMKNVKEYPKFGACVLVVFLISIVSAVFTQDLSRIAANEQSLIFIERYGVDFINMSGAMELISSPGMSALTVVITAATSLVMPFVTAFFSCLILLILTKIFRGSARFKQYYAMIFHIYIVTYLLSLIPTFFMIANESTVNILSLAILMPGGNMTNPMFNLLHAVTIIGIWEAVLIFIGVKEMNEYSAGKAVAITVVNYGLSVGFAVLVQAGTLVYYDWLYNLTTGLSF